MLYIYIYICMYVCYIALLADLFSWSLLYQLISIHLFPLLSSSFTLCHHLWSFFYCYLLSSSVVLTFLLGWWMTTWPQFHMPILSLFLGDLSIITHCNLNGAFVSKMKHSAIWVDGFLLTDKLIFNSITVLVMFSGWLIVQIKLINWSCFSMCLMVRVLIYMQNCGVWGF